MPPRRKKYYGSQRRFAKRRRGFRGRIRKFGRKRTGGPSKTIIRNPSGFPDRLFVKLKWAQQFTFTMAAGAASSLAIVGNTIWKPSAPTDHLPYASDQWAAFYEKFRVYGSKIRCEASTGNADTGTGSYILAIVPQILNTSALVPYPLDEQPYAKWRTCAPNTHNVAKNFMSTARMFGVRKSSVKDDFYDWVGTTLAGGGWSGPPQAWNWIINTVPVAVADSITAYLMITIEFFVEFFSRADLSTST